MFIIKQNKDIKKIYSSSLHDVFPNGVYCAEMNSSKEYLLIGSFASSNSYNYKQTTNGISIWRVLNSEPWIKHVDIVSDQNSKQKEANKCNRSSTKMNFSKIVTYFFL